MIGYFKPIRKSCSVNISEKTKKFYTSLYCGICKELKDRYGYLSTLLINYDTLFAALCVYDKKVSFSDIVIKRCTINPLKNVPVHLNKDFLEKSVELTLLLVYFKLFDDKQDKDTLHKYFFCQYLKSHFKKLKEKLRSSGFDFKRIENLLKEQKDIEENFSERDFYKLSKNSAEISKYIMEFYAKSYNQDKNTIQKLGELGYHLGILVYLLDACDDFKRDYKNKAFNAVMRCFAHKRGNIIIINREKIKNIIEKEKLFVDEIFTELNHLPNYEYIINFWKSSKIYWSSLLIPSDIITFDIRKKNFLESKTGIIEWMLPIVCCCMCCHGTKIACCGADRDDTEMQECLNRLMCCIAFDTCCWPG